jgi:ribosomal protein S18 acetylase RimI-like enzyme
VTREPARVRSVQASDLDDLYRVCLLTADGGQDATPLFSDPQLPGHIFAAPYAIFEPAHAFVVEDASGVGGYIVGALDTLAFEAQLEREWWPGLRARYPVSAAQPRDGMSLPEQEARSAIHHPWTVAPELAERFPSHLHINLLPRLQGRGLGRELIETFASSLRADGSRGLHLFVSSRNPRAAAFYDHVGFSELPADGVHIYAMDFGPAVAAG